MEQLKKHLPEEWVYTPADHAAAARTAHAWPSIAQMQAEGKRLLLVSRVHLGDEMTPLVFARWCALVLWSLDFRRLHHLHAVESVCFHSVVA